MENKITRELLEQEIKGSEAALKAHKNGILVHQIVLKGFQDALAKLPPKDEKNAKK